MAYSSRCARGELSDVVAGELVVGRPVFVAGLLSGVGRIYSLLLPVDDDSKPKLKTQGSLLRGVIFYNMCLSFGTQVRNFLQRFSMRFSSSCWESLAIFVGFKTSRRSKTVRYVISFLNSVSFQDTVVKCTV